MSYFTRYIISCITVALLLFVSYQYVVSANTIRREGDELTRFIIAGIILFVINGVAGVFLVYYGSKKYQANRKQSDKGTELAALGGLFGNKKNITISLAVSDEEYSELLETGTLMIHSDRIHLPVMAGDQLNVTNKGSAGKSTTATIRSIDGYNQKIVIDKTP